MIITQTPFRMSFIGGGTDMPDFFGKFGGAVISTTFDKYCYVNVRHLPRFFEYANEVVYSKIERVKNIEDIEHPLIRHAISMCDMHEIRLSYEADLPARTGLGTSSSFAVGMLSAFHALKGTYASKERLAKEAIYLERTLCAEAGGWQDQIAAAFGGFNRIDFKEGVFEVTPIIMKPNRKRELDSNLMLFFTGFTRFSAEVQASHSKRDKTPELLAMLDLVDEAEHILADKHTSLRRFGEILHRSWTLKKGFGDKVSTDSIDAMYERALASGAVGGKLLGAGGGGFLLLYVEPDAQESVKRALSDYRHIPFAFEEGGSRVIHYAPEEYEGRHL